MKIRKFVKETIQQISSESNKIKRDSEQEFEAMSVHSAEFREQFRAAQSEIREKRKSIQKIMR